MNARSHETRGAWVPGHVVITGAAGAIGAALARGMRAAWPEVQLALVDRDDVALQAVARELRATSSSAAKRATSSSAALRSASSSAALREASSSAALREASSSAALRSASSSAALREASSSAALREASSNAALREASSSAAISTHVADLAKLDTLPALIAAIEENGPIDGLVNCAGIMRVQHVSSWNWNDAEQLLAIDLLAPLRLQDLVVRGMVERGAGVIINVASMAGRVPLRGCAYYGAAKAGLAMASEIARADLAERGVQVLTVYPGPVRSALEAGARADYGGGGLFGRFAPTGDPAELADRVLAAIAEDEPRVIYPRLYGVGWTAPNLSSWIALSYGPPPVH